jgi:hypothetical protein
MATKRKQGNAVAERALRIVVRENERLREAAQQLQGQALSANCVLLAMLVEYGGAFSIGEGAKQRVEREFTTLGWRADVSASSPAMSVVTLVEPGE